MITINLPLEEVRMLLGLQDGQTIDYLFYNRHPAKLNGLDVMIVKFEEYITNEGISRGCRYRNLRMIKLDLETIQLVSTKEDKVKQALKTLLDYFKEV